MAKKNGLNDKLVESYISKKQEKYEEQELKTKIKNFILRLPKHFLLGQIMNEK